MIIRKLTLDDKEKLDALIEVIEENLADPNFWLPINDTAREHFFDDDWTEFYGMFDGEVLAAAAALFYNEHEFGESVKELNSGITGVAEIGRAMVHPEYRGSNLLYSINTKLVEVAREKGFRYLLATIYPENLPSQRSFIKLGMTKQTTYRKSSGFVRDVFLMKIG